MKLSKQYLFYLAGALWALAGTMVLSFGLRALLSRPTHWKILGALIVFAVFYLLIFLPLVKKHEKRIVEDARQKMPWWMFFDRKGYLFIAVMMPVGIFLRLCGFVPRWFFAFFIPDSVQRCCCADCNFFTRDFVSVKGQDLRKVNRKKTQNRPKNSWPSPKC